METSEVRNRLRLAIDRARNEATARRARADQSARSFEAFVGRVATPVFKQFANALVVEGYSFRVFTPASGLRLASERSPEDFIELALDNYRDPPLVLARVNRGRGSRVSTREVPLGAGMAIDALSEEDVLQVLLREIPPFVER